MNILQICPHYLPAVHFGGVQHVAHSIGQSLINFGNSVHVCTTNLKNHKMDLDVTLSSPININGVIVFYEKIALSRYWGFSTTLVERVISEVEWADIVFIHFHYQFASLIGGWISRVKKKPYIIFSHGSLNTFGISNRRTFLKRMYLRFLEYGNFSHAAFIAYHSKEEMENSLQFGKVQVVNNGIAPESFLSLPPKGYFSTKFKALNGKFVFLYLGRIDVGKGLDILLPAFKRLTKHFPNSHLVVAGGDERGYAATVVTMIDTLGLAEKVTLTGLLSGNLKLGALLDADVFVLPSRSEGLSIAMLEAMYMGLPVIVSNRVGLWMTIIEKQMGWVVKFEESALFEAMRHAAESPDLKAIGQRGRDLISTQYTWDVITSKLTLKLKKIVK